MLSPSLPRLFLLSGIGWVFLGLGNIAEPAETEVEELLQDLESPIKVKRLQAMKALGKNGTAAKEAVASLIDHMRKHKDKDLANQAAQTLAQIGPPAATELIKALEDPAAAVQIRALSALGIIGPQASQAVGPVSRFLENKDAKIRALAAWVLGEIGPPARPVADSLAKALRDGDSQVRRLAAEALHEIGSEMVIRLLPVLKDDDLTIRLSAVQSLVLFHDRKEAVQALVDAVRDPNIKVRKAAAASLVRLGAEAKIALPSLLDSLNEPDLEVQSKAFTAILAIGSNEDVRLLGKLSSINQSQRWTGPYLLKQFGPRPNDAVKPLLRLLQDADATNRLGATLALAKLAPVSKTVVAGGLKKAQKDLNAAVQAAATVALAVTGPNRGQDADEAGKLITGIAQKLKDSEEVDPDKVVQLYILVSALSSSGFLGDQPDPKLKNQLEETMNWASQAVDNLPPLAVPALVRGINCCARFQLAFTAPFSRLSLKLIALAQDSDDIPCLTYAMNHLGKAIPKDSPYSGSIQRSRFKVLTDSMLLEKAISSMDLDIDELNNWLRMFPPICHLQRGDALQANLLYGKEGDRFVERIYTTTRNVKVQLKKSLEKEKQLLLLHKKQKLFIKTEELTRKLWNKPIPFLVEKLTDPDPVVRWAAVQIISRKRIPAEKELIERLSDPNVEVRDAAHKALVRLGRTIDFGLQPRLWTAWLGVQEPSTYRPGSSAEDFDLRLGEKKKKKE
jgi:HEAT repeat protein